MYHLQERSVTSVIRYKKCAQIFALKETRNSLKLLPLDFEKK